MPSPEELFARFRQRGDVEALGQVFDAVAPELLLVAAHLVRRGGAHGEAEDLVQATFVDAIEKVARWDPARPLLPWLIGILANHVRERRRQRRRPELPPRLPAAGAEPLAAAAANEVGAAVARGLRGVPRAMRPALVLRLVHDLSPVQIARVLGCPLPTVKARLQRGMRWLRRGLPRGLAALVIVPRAPTLTVARREVLAAARRTRTVADRAALGASFAGAALAKWITAIAVIVVLLGVAVGAWPGWLAATAPAGVPIPAPVAASIATSERVVASPARDTRELVMPAPARLPATGDATFAFFWHGTELPARHLQIWWQSSGAPGRHRCFADGEGRLALRDLPLGPLTLFNFAFRQVVAIAPGPNGEQRFEVRAPYVVHGRVADDFGRGIPAARVYAQGWDQGEDPRPRLVAIADETGAFVARTDRGGSFWARCERFAPSAPVAIDTPDAVRGALTLVLPAAATALAGEVRTLNGAPASGALLTIVSTGNPDRAPVPVVASADANGRYRVDELGAGPHLLVAEVAEHVPTVVPVVLNGGEQRLDITASRGASLVGVLRTGDRAPLQGRIRCVLALPGRVGETAALDSVRQTFERSTWSSADTGEFRLDGLPAAALHLEAASATTTRARTDVVLCDGETRRCDLVLPRGATLHGRVEGPTGEPLANWNVSVVTDSPLGLPGAVTARDGSFAVHGIDADVCHVTVASQGDSPLPATHVARVVVDGSERVVRVAALANAARLRGAIAAAPADEPIVDWRMSVLPAGFPAHAARSLQVRPGRFELGPFAAGAYEIALHRGGVPPGGRTRITLAPGQVLDLGELDAPR